MSEKGEGQTAIALLTYRLGAALLDLIANGLGNALGIDAEAHPIEQVLAHRGVDEHGARVIEDSLQVGIQVNQQQSQTRIILADLQHRLQRDQIQG